ncbi:7-carboxy-7-deazaguanine synthase [Wenzhouxiangella sp. XN24]|uniref:7-carboxy-7-deazaguanine synthase n=1 Tax=Wenzhouxiangella sp. XN24 TaxID=2713569 RepID=UPI0013EC2F18|nr:7-carboxy-7-deazaguanine synthase [Wenzhouxiangella sp. XN24]NGX16025.1 7-carboxy-7-deazaguanine synthase [Wenzhouxiangella sp. XN24]
MAYSVKEIYYTLQGEGAQAGRPAVFLRFAGCNLWSGREQDRHKGPGGCSRWCDTDFVGTDGPGGGKFATAEELAKAVARHWPDLDQGKPYVVCTGGEPLLQLDAAAIEALHEAGFEVGVETNGTILAPPGLDWICVSPKPGPELLQQTGNELKLVFPQEQLEAQPAQFEKLGFDHLFLQPLDGPDAVLNTKRAAAYCMSNPKWRLSLQIHKLIGMP